MPEPLDTACPWCGEELYHPFTGRDLKTQAEYDMALEAHATEPCEPMAAELGLVDL